MFSSFTSNKDFRIDTLNFEIWFYLQNQWGNINWRSLSVLLDFKRSLIVLKPWRVLFNTKLRDIWRTAAIIFNKLLLRNNSFHDVFSLHRGLKSGNSYLVLSLLKWSWLLKLIDLVFNDWYSVCLFVSWPRTINNWSIVVFTLLALQLLLKWIILIL